MIIQQLQNIRKKFNEIVTITCYGNTERVSRKKALKDYYFCMLNSEGAEHERYEKIFFQVLKGNTECTDEIEFWEM